MHSLGKISKDFQEFYKEPENVQKVLSGFPFIPKNVAASAEVGGAASAFAQSPQYVFLIGRGVNFRDYRLFENNPFADSDK